MRGRWIGLVSAGVLATVAVAPASALAADSTGAAEAVAATGATGVAGVADEATGGDGPMQGVAPKSAAKPADLSVHVHGVRHGKVGVGHRARAVGYLRPFVVGEHVHVKLLRKGHVVQSLNPKVKEANGGKAGRYKFRSPTLIKPGSYRIVAQHEANSRQGGASARSPKFSIRYPDLDPGDRSSAVHIFNHLLLRDGYYTTHGKHYSNKTGFAVMAFRKVNKMHRTFNANPHIFKAVAGGKGRFHLKYPGAGKHVEVDISRQVMVLANHGKAKYTFHVSTGAPGMATIRGHYQFYRRQPGFNSEGMYYSVYWHGGYAIHGYHSVPPYPASHGCVRNEIPDAKFAYNWVALGMSIYVYN
jgi:L,D-transpeptidase catalytic domain